MAIPTEVVEEFDPKIRERGHEYYIAGDVRILETGDGFLRAVCMGLGFTMSPSISAMVGSTTIAIALTPRAGAGLASMCGRRC